MKKLIMFIAVAAMAVVGYSAEVMWGAGNNWIKDKNGGNLAQGTSVYLVLASDATAIGSALAAGTSIDSYVLDTATTSNTKGAVANRVASSDKLTAGNTYSLAVLIMQGDDYVISGGQNFTAYTAGVDEPDSGSFASTQGSNPTSAWGPKSGSGGGGEGGAPEPTSALLLLVGGAMLALRRKRA